jgi:probable F420-dependent oxidoreductase
MRFSYTEVMTDPTYYVPLAQAAEDAGYDGFIVPDSIFYPADADSTYPYNADGTREFLADKPFIEPFSLIPALGAVTTRLTFATFVIKLPIRNPVLIAKQVSSVAVLTNNRLHLGVGTSPWQEDYDVCDVPWKGRGRRMDEAMEIVRGLTNGGFFEYHGEVYDFSAVKLTPVPTEPVPLLIGGHGDAALRRAARLADGWMSAKADDDLLERGLTRLAELRREYGRDQEPFLVYTPSIEAFTVDGVRRLEELGVTDVIVGFRDPYVAEPDHQPLAEKLDLLRWYADNVIAKAS